MLFDQADVVATDELTAEAITAITLLAVRITTATLRSALRRGQLNDEAAHRILTDGAERLQGTANAVTTLLAANASDQLQASLENVHRIQQLLLDERTSASWTDTVAKLDAESSRPADPHKRRTCQPPSHVEATRPGQQI